MYELMRTKQLDSNNDIIKIIFGFSIGFFFFFYNLFINGYFLYIFLKEIFIFFKKDSATWITKQKQYI